MTQGSQSRLPCRPISIYMPHTWHDVFLTPQRIETFISIHMPHTWHDEALEIAHDWAEWISIHMPHTWHDRIPLQWPAMPPYFNPHATYVA